MKWLILLLLGWLIWRLLRAKSARRPPSSARTRDGEAVRACAHCGLNVPESEVLSDGRRFYCSETHLRLGSTSGEDRPS